MRKWICLLFLLLVIGCNEKSTKPPADQEPSDYLPQTSITNVLANLRQSYLDMDYDEYEKLLDSTYVFAFDPDDVGPGNDFQEEWPREDDLISTERMFTGQPNSNGQMVDAIELDFVAGEPATSPIDPAWQRVILTMVELTVETTDGHGEKWFLNTPGNYEAEFDFVQTDEGGSMVWKIVRFADKPPSGILARPVTESTTWGVIKMLFR